jgi:hypothetical protein
MFHCSAHRGATRPTAGVDGVTGFCQPWIGEMFRSTSGGPQMFGFALFRWGRVRGDVVVCMTSLPVPSFTIIAD